MSTRSLRILVTNDDGIHADGLAVLEEAARALSDDVWVVAPETEQSGAARSLTLSHPIRVRVADERKYAVAGTPTDCVMLAVTELIEGRKPDLVLSGVNRGQNMAEDVTLSGTVAAAFQGMTLGIRSIALSQARMREAEPRWDTARRFAPDAIARLIEAGWPDDVVMNINFPDADPDEVKGAVVTRQGQREDQTLHAEARTDLRGRGYYWFGFKGRDAAPEPGTDIHAVYGGAISITPLHLQLTHEDTLKSLSAHFESEGG